MKRLKEGEVVDCVILSAAAIHAHAREREGAEALIRFFKTPAAAAVIRKTGMAAV